MFIKEQLLFQISSHVKALNYRDLRRFITLQILIGILFIPICLWFKIRISCYVCVISFLWFRHLLLVLCYHIMIHKELEVRWRLVFAIFLIRLPSQNTLVHAMFIRLIRFLINQVSSFLYLICLECMYFPFKITTSQYLQKEALRFLIAYDIFPSFSSCYSQYLDSVLEGCLFIKVFVTKVLQSKLS